MAAGRPVFRLDSNPEAFAVVTEDRLSSGHQYLLEHADHPRARLEVAGLEPAAAVFQLLVFCRADLRLFYQWWRKPRTAASRCKRCLNSSGAGPNLSAPRPAPVAPSLPTPIDLLIDQFLTKHDSYRQLQRLLGFTTFEKDNLLLQRQLLRATRQMAYAFMTTRRWRRLHELRTSHDFYEFCSELWSECTGNSLTRELAECLREACNDRKLTEEFLRPSSDVVLDLQHLPDSKEATKNSWLSAQQCDGGETPRAVIVQSLPGELNSRELVTRLLLLLKERTSWLYNVKILELHLGRGGMLQVAKDLLIDSPSLEKITIRFHSSTGSFRELRFSALPSLKHVQIMAPHRLDSLYFRNCTVLPSSGRKCLEIRACVDKCYFENMQVHTAQEPNLQVDWATMACNEVAISNSPGVSLAGLAEAKKPIQFVPRNQPPAAARSWWPFAAAQEDLTATILDGRDDYRVVLSAPSAEQLEQALCARGQDKLIVKNFRGLWPKVEPQAWRILEMQDCPPVIYQHAETVIYTSSEAQGVLSITCSSPRKEQESFTVKLECKVTQELELETDSPANREVTPLVLICETPPPPQVSANLRVRERLTVQINCDQWSINETLLAARVQDFHTLFLRGLDSDTDLSGLDIKISRLVVSLADTTAGPWYEQQRKPPVIITTSALWKPRSPKLVECTSNTRGTVRNTSDTRGMIVKHDEIKYFVGLAKTVDLEELVQEPDPRGSPPHFFPSAVMPPPLTFQRGGFSNFTTPKLP